MVSPQVFGGGGEGLNVTDAEHSQIASLVRPPALSSQPFGPFVNGRPPVQLLRESSAADTHVRPMVAQYARQLP